MKSLLQIYVAIVLLSALSLADEYAVISNKNMKNLSITQIKAIFLKKSTLTNDVKVVPVNLAARDSLRLKFEKEILHMSFQRLKVYWTKQHYLGKRPPISMKSQESVKTFVKKIEGSIGYINAKSVDESVNVIYKWSD